ncbi:MAG: RNA 2',3'-cyclic phosphodiesterase [Candidatus Micrarchaeota archaeon]
MRLFVGIVPPEGVVGSLQNLQVEAKKLLPEHSITDERKATPEHFRIPHSPWRLSKKDSLHLTLQFLGDGISHHRCDEIAAALSKVGQEKFEVECYGAGAFPSPQAARVLWAGAKSLELSDLAREVNSQMGKVGFAAGKPFSPHISIARCKFPSNVSEFARAYADKEWHGQKWAVDSFSLIESIITFGGHEYNQIRKYQLL